MGGMFGPPDPELLAAQETVDRRLAVINKLFYTDIFRRSLLECGLVSAEVQECSAVSAVTSVV